MEENLKIEQNEFKICPFCAEEIKKEAKVCKHCGKDIPTEEEIKTIELKKYIENKKYKGEKITYLKTEGNKVFVEFQSIKFSLIIFIILSILWIIPGILYLIYWIFNKNKKQTHIINIGENGEVTKSFGIDNEYFKNYNEKLGVKNEIKDDKNKKYIVYLILAIFIIIFFKSMSSLLSNIPENQNITEKSYTTLEKIEIVFEGGYSKENIQKELDKSLKIFGEEINDLNYEKYADVLVSLRKNIGVQEYKILKCINEGEEAIKKSKMDFKSYAAICSSLLN